MSAEKLAALRKQGLIVFLDILRSHRKKLPLELRSFGDVYVKQEFKQHQDANYASYQVFLTQWTQYLKDLQRSKDFKQMSKTISEEDKSFLNDDQKKTLDKLKQETQKSFGKQ